MNWNLRYARERKFQKIRNFYNPLSDSSEAGQSISYPNYPNVAWSLTPGKTSSAPTPERQRAEVPANQNGTPMHMLVNVVNKLFSSIKSKDDNRLRRGLFGELYEPDRVRQHLKDTIDPVNGKPDAMVKVYRTVPKGVDTIYHGDQVTTDPNRAMAIAIRGKEESQVAPPSEKSQHILYAMVPAKHLISALGTGKPGDQYDTDNVTRWSDYGYFPKD